MPLYEEVAGMGAVLAVTALLIAGIGGLMLSQATVGVGVIAGACLLAILARMVQADGQHREIARRLDEIGRLVALEPPAPAPSPDWICMQCGTLAPVQHRPCPLCETVRPGF